MRMLPLLKLRVERILIMRDVERDIAELQSLVNALDLPEYAFDPSKWTIDFSEVTQPLAETEKDAVFEKRRQLGLTNTLDEVMRRNPDLESHKEAMKVLEANIEVETLRISKMRKLQAMSGSMGSSTEDIQQRDGKQPFEANRGKPEDDSDAPA